MLLFEGALGLSTSSWTVKQKLQSSIFLDKWHMLPTSLHALTRFLHKYILFFGVTVPFQATPRTPSPSQLLPSLAPRHSV